MLIDSDMLPTMHIFVSQSILPYLIVLIIFTLFTVKCAERSSELTSMPRQKLPPTSPTKSHRPTPRSELLRRRQGRPHRSEQHPGPWHGHIEAVAIPRSCRFYHHPVDGASRETSPYRILRARFPWTCQVGNWTG